MTEGSDGQRLHANVRGFVQGVGFRVYILRRARALGLTGWVANRPDGSVEVVAEGPLPELQELEAILRRGPGSATVDDVETERSAATGSFEGFQVRAGHHGGD
jgi:acylphosphatase